MLDTRCSIPVIVTSCGFLEFGSRNAECGNYEKQTFGNFHFRIPHSEFRIPHSEFRIPLIPHPAFHLPNSNMVLIPRRTCPLG